MSWWSGNFSSGQPAVKFHGLVNQGSTCYLNSVLQVLFMTREFREAVIRFATENSDRKFIDGDLKELFDDLLERETYTYKIRTTLGITRVHEQQDAAEYFEKILRMTSPHAAEIFHGQMAHRTTCSVCKTEDDRDGPFWHLPLELVDSSSGNYSVEEGIKRFFTASDFSGDNQMYCDHCDTKVDATSRYVIKHHPDVLILLLKRFDFSYKFMSYIKINRSADVPHTLKIPEKQTYELYAVVDHSGDLRSGHYSATIKPQDEDSWYSFDDSRVSQSEHSPFLNSETTSSTRAYLLFYRRKVDAAEMSEERKEDDTKEKGSKTRKRPLDAGTDDGDSGSRKKKSCGFSVDGQRSAYPAADDGQNEISDAQRIKTGINEVTEEEEEEETEMSDSQPQKETVKLKDSDDQKEEGEKLSDEDQNDVHPEKVELTETKEKKHEDSRRSAEPAEQNREDENKSVHVIFVDVTGSENKKTEERTDSSGCLLEEMREKDENTDEQEDLKNIMDLTNREPMELSDTQRTEKDTTGDEKKQTEEEEEGETENCDRQSQKETVKDEEAEEQEEEEGEKLSDEDQSEVDHKKVPAAHDEQDERSFLQQEVTGRKTEGEIIKHTSEDKTEDQEKNRPLDSRGEKTEMKDPEKDELTETKENKYEDTERPAEPAADEHDEVTDAQRIKMDKVTGINEEKEEQETEKSDIHAEDMTEKDENADDLKETRSLLSAEDQNEVKQEAIESEKLGPNNNLDFKPEDSQRSAEPAAYDGHDEKNNIQVIFVDVTGSENKETEERTDSSGRPSEEMREKDENTDEQEHLKNIMDLTNREPTELSDTQRTVKDTTGDEKKQTEEEEEDLTLLTDDQEETRSLLSTQDQNKIKDPENKEATDSEKFLPNNNLDFKPEDSQRSAEPAADEGQDEKNNIQVIFVDVTGSENKETEERTDSSGRPSEEMREKDENTDEQEHLNKVLDLGTKEPTELSDTQRTEKDTTGDEEKQTEEEEETENCDSQSQKETVKDEADDQEEEGEKVSDGDQNEVKDPENKEAPESEILGPNNNLDFKPEDSRRSAEPAADEGHDEVSDAQRIKMDKTTGINEPTEEEEQETEKSDIHAEDVTEKDENTDDMREGEKLPDEDQNDVHPEKAELTETKEKKHEDGQRSAEPAADGHGEMIVTQTLPTDETTDENKQPEDQGTQETEKSDIHAEDVTERDENTDDQEETRSLLSAEEQIEAVDPEAADPPEDKEMKPGEEPNVKLSGSKVSAGPTVIYKKHSDRDEERKVGHLLTEEKKRGSGVKRVEDVIVKVDDPEVTASLLPPEGQTGVTDPENLSEADHRGLWAKYKYYILIGVVTVFLGLCILALVLIFPHLDH